MNRQNNASDERNQGGSRRSRSGEKRSQNGCRPCPPGLRGPAGPQGPVGPRGPMGLPGPAGPAGGILGFADYYALMPPDNVAEIAPGADIAFPQDGTSGGTSIVRMGPSSFRLTDIGSYQVFFQVNTDQSGQLILTLNGVDLPYTVVGRTTGTSQIVGMTIVTTTAANCVLTVRNPAGNTTPLTITPRAGGTRPVSAHLVIVRLQ